MAWCSCNVAAEFKELDGLGIISANFKASTNFTITQDGLVMHGPAIGDLSLSAYAPLIGTLTCPGRAGTSFGWTQKIDCDSLNGVLKVYFIPNGIAKSYMEGDVTNQIEMQTASNVHDYKTFEANASSGPASPSLLLTHRDGHTMIYTGNPIQVDGDSGKGETVVPFMTTILPLGSTLYLNNFSWTYDPPDIPKISYSFLFKYDG